MTARWLPRTRDVTAMAVGVLVAADALVTRLADHHPVSAWVAFVAAAAGTAVLWWRRSHPVTVTVLGLVLCVTLQIEWTLAAGLTTLAIRRRDRLTWLLSGAAVAALTIESLVGAPHGRHDLVGSLTLSVPWVALFTCTGALLGMRRASIADLKDRAERAEAEQEMRAEQSRLNERTRIATEMHDVLAHRISLIALHAGGLEVTEDPNAASVRQTAGLIRETAHTALEDLRGILGVLKSPDGRRAELAPQPRFADLRELIQASVEAGVPITVSGSVGFDAEVPEPLGRAVYRVVQESLTNVHKHAAGAGTLIRLAGSPGRVLEVCVENLAPPVSGPSLPGSGSGLVGLRERVTVAGGTLDARALRGGGFRVRARLPWPDEAVSVGLDGAGVGGPLGSSAAGDAAGSGAGGRPGSDGSARTGSGRNGSARIGSAERGTWIADVVPGVRLGGEDGEELMAVVVELAAVRRGEQVELVLAPGPGDTLQLGHAPDRQPASESTSSAEAGHARPADTALTPRASRTDAPHTGAPGAATSSGRPDTTCLTRQDTARADGLDTAVSGGRTLRLIPSPTGATAHIGAARAATTDPAATAPATTTANSSTVGTTNTTNTTNTTSTASTNTSSTSTSTSTSSTSTSSTSEPIEGSTGGALSAAAHAASPAAGGVR